MLEQLVVTMSGRFKPTKYYLKAAEKAGLRVYPGAKHWKLEGNDPKTGYRSVMMCPHEIKSPGTEFAIRKWLIKMGVVFSLLTILLVKIL